MLVFCLSAAAGFAFMFWLGPVVMGWLGVEAEWYWRWGTSLVGGLLCGAYGAGIAKRENEKELIHRADVERAREYLASRESQDNENC